MKHWTFAARLESFPDIPEVSFEKGNPSYTTFEKIKQMAMSMPGSTDGRLATIGALSLYLDFINLFLYLLRFFGSSRD